VAYVAPAASPVASAERALSRVGALCLVELQRLRHDRSELYTRAIQPTLWLVIFGVTFTRLHAIPTGGLPYLDFLAPGVLAQSGLFISIFYGIQTIWERDAGVLAKLLVTPTPRTALIAGKAFAAGVRAISQVVVVLVVSAILGVALTTNRCGWPPRSSPCGWRRRSSPACRCRSRASCSSASA
jgi:ABC-2 type transport system permease protein